MASEMFLRLVTTGTFRSIPSIYNQGDSTPGCIPRSPVATSCSEDITSPEMDQFSIYDKMSLRMGQAIVFAHLGRWYFRFWLWFTFYNAKVIVIS